MKILNSAVAAFVLINLVSCTSVEPSDSGSNARSQQTPNDNAKQTPPNLQTAPSGYVPPTSHDSDHVAPPSEYYTAIIAEMIEELGQAKREQNEKEKEKEQPTAVLWVNFEGADLRWGFTNGKTYLMCDKKGTFPKAALTDEQKAAIIPLAQSYFDAVDVKILVTATKPTEGKYTTIHVGGTIESLGCLKNNNILGIAPLDYLNRNKTDTGFVFSDLIDPLKFDIVFMLATTIVHEAGHTFGLEHINNVRDIMHPVAHTVVDGFGAGRVVGGLGNRYQDSPLILRKQVGSLHEEDPVDPVEGKDMAICNAIRNIQDFLGDKLAGRVTGNESFFNVPEFCE